MISSIKGTAEELNQAKRLLPDPDLFKKGERCWVYTPERLYLFKLSVYRTLHGVLIRKWKPATTQLRNEHMDFCPHWGISINNTTPFRKN